MNAWFARSKSSMLMLLDLDLDPRIHRSVDRTREKLITYAAVRQNLIFDYANKNIVSICTPLRQHEFEAHARDIRRTMPYFQTGL